MMIRIATTAFLKPEIGSTSPGSPPFQNYRPAAALKQKGIWLKKTMEANLFHQDAELSFTLAG